MDSLRNNNGAPKQQSLVLYFQVHQPKRLRTFRFFDIGSGQPATDEELDREIIQRVARESYIPANNVLLKLLHKNPQINVTFSLSGVIIDQLEEYAPEVLDSFRDLAATGSVEFLAETYHHSLACMIPGKEFEAQIIKHSEKIYEHFGVRPTVFRNTELIYNNDIGKRVRKLGLTGVLSDGVERVLDGRSPNHVYQHPDQADLKILLRNYRLSDDIAFRFTETGKPLTAEKYFNWLTSVPKDERVITLAMDYETFGEHQKKETGIFRFLEELLARLAKSKHMEMLTVSQALQRVEAHSVLNVPHFISWADQERDLSAWLGNEMQRDAFDSVINLEFDIKNLNDKGMLEQWRNLLTSDHFYYMSTKKGSDGSVHTYFSPYPSPYEAFINYMNVLTDFSMRVKILKAGKIEDDKSVRASVSQRPQSMSMRMTMLAAN
jgi:alpha-amylase